MQSPGGSTEAPQGMWGSGKNLQRTPHACVRELRNIEGLPSLQPLHNLLLSTDLKKKAFLVALKLTQYLADAKT